MKIIGPFTKYYVKKKIPQKQRKIKEQIVLKQLVEQVKEIKEIAKNTEIDEEIIKEIIENLIEKRKVEGKIEKNKFVSLKKKGEKILEDLTDEERKKKFEQILEKYEEIEIDTMAELLGFVNEIELQKFLLDLPTENIRIKGKMVYVNKDGVSGEIENLLEQFQKWEKTGFGKA